MPFVGVWGAPRPRITPSTTLVCPIWPRFPPNLPFASEEFWGVTMERRGSTRDQGSRWVGCPRVLRYQPQPFDATVGPSGRTVYHTVRAQWPRLAAGRPGSSPSPWHGKVVGSAMTAVRKLGRVCLRAHGPWGHCHAICWCVGSSMAAHHHTLDHSCVPDLAPFSAKFATCERGVWGCGDGTAGFHA